MEEISRSSSAQEDSSFVTLHSVNVVTQRKVPKRKEKQKTIAKLKTDQNSKKIESDNPLRK